MQVWMFRLLLKDRAKKLTFRLIYKIFSFQSLKDEESRTALFYLYESKIE